MKLSKLITLLILSLLPVTINAQTFWQEVYSGNLENPTLKLSSNGVIYTISDLTLISSSDHGQSWQNRYQLNQSWSVPRFTTSPKGLIYLAFDSLKKSSDEGNSWIEFNNPYYSPSLLLIESNSQGVLFTEVGNLAGGGSYRSEDDGDTWINIGVAQSILKQIAFHPQDITFGIYQANLPAAPFKTFKSSNNGDDWNEMQELPDQLRMIYCAANGNIYGAAYLNDILYRSTDLGSTWMNILDKRVTSITENANSVLFAATELNGVYRSTDQGDTWEQINEGLAYLSASKLIIDTAGYLYAVNGITSVIQTKIHRSINPTTFITGVNEPYVKTFGFTLDQNYPNPFNPSTIISYSVPQAAFVNISVYNITGSEVALLVNEEKAPGAYSVNFNAASLSSGLYFCRLTASGFTLTRKMILLK